MDALAVTAWATLALAAVGLISIVTNVFLGWQTRNAAEAAKTSTKLQEREIALFERQYLDAQRSAFPHLRVHFKEQNANAVKGTLSVLAGTALATDVKVWARTAAGYFVKPYQQVSPTLPYIDFEATTRENDVSRCPFPEFQKLLGDEQGWIGVTSAGPAGQSGKFRQRLLRDGSRYVDDIEEVTGPGA